MKTKKEKQDALNEKGRLNPNWMMFWHRVEISEFANDNRFWIMVFTKPYGYKHGPQEDVWYAQIWVWDTHKEVWHNKIIIKDSALLGQFTIIGNHDRIFIQSKYYLTVCSIDDENYTVYSHTIKNDGFTPWHMPGRTTLLLDCGDHLWSEFDLIEHIEKEYNFTPDAKLGGEETFIHHVNDQITIIICRISKNAIGGFHIGIWQHNQQISDVSATSLTRSHTKKRYYPIGSIILPGLIPSKYDNIIWGETTLQIGDIILPLASLANEKS